MCIPWALPSSKPGKSVQRMDALAAHPTIQSRTVESELALAIKIFQRHADEEMAQRAALLLCIMGHVCGGELVVQAEECASLQRPGVGATGATMTCSIATSW